MGGRFELDTIETACFVQLWRASVVDVEEGAQATESCYDNTAGVSTRDTTATTSAP